MCSPHISAALQSGGFSLHYRVGRLFTAGFLAQCCIIAASAAWAIFIGSTIDGSLILGGRNVGLLQHPGIWAFFGLQIALPLSIRQSLKNLLRSRSKIRAIARMDERFSELIIVPLLQFLRLQDVESRLTAAVVYGAGLSAFIWNTYQNQMPG